MTASASALDLNEGYMYICILNVERTLLALRLMETITYFKYGLHQIFRTGVREELTVF